MTGEGHAIESGFAFLGSKNKNGNVDAKMIAETRNGICQQYWYRLDEIDYVHAYAA